MFDNEAVVTNKIHETELIYISKISTPEVQNCFLLED